MGIIESCNAIIWNKVRLRFMKRVLKTDTCWIWQGASNGIYPLCHVLGASKTVFAHRLSFELFKTPIIDGNVVMHTCDNPMCVNPDHLAQGTQLQNMTDMYEKGRGRSPGPKIPLYGADNPACKITESTALAIRKETGLSVRKIAIKYEISPSQVHRILKNRSWVELHLTH